MTKYLFVLVCILRGSLPAQRRDVTQAARAAMLAPPDEWQLLVCQAIRSISHFGRMALQQR